MIDPLVSVILPVYNVAPYVKAAANSILRQSYDRLELILIDDGSTDETLDLIRPLSADSRVRLISRENRGLIETLNEGLELAQGELIARMDGDDVSYPHRLATQVEAFRNDDSLALCGAHVDFLVSDHRTISVTPRALTPSEIRVANIFDVYLVHPTYMFRRKLTEHFVYNKNYVHCEDFEFLRNVTRHHKARFLKEPLLAFRLGRPGGVRTMHMTRQATTHLRVVDENLKYFGILVESDDRLLSLALSDQPIAPHVEEWRILLNTIKRGTQKFSAYEDAFLVYYGFFLNHLFKVLIIHAGAKAAISLFGHLNLLEALPPRERLFVHLMNSLGETAALQVQSSLIRMRQWAKARSSPLLLEAGR